MYTCSQCGEKTLKFKKDDLALYVNVIPDSKNRPQYKNQNITVKILGNKCIAAFDFDKQGNPTYSKTRTHDYICQAFNSKNNFPAHEHHLYPITEGNQIMKNLLTK